MKKHVLLLAFAALTAIAVRAASDAESASQRFFGKIVTIDAAQHTLTAHNRNKNADLSFAWNDETAFLANKKPASAGSLQIGQFVQVAYVAEGDKNLAKRVVVRPQPFHKKTNAPESN